MRTLFKGGSVISGAGARQADLLVEDEKVAALGRNLKAAVDRVVDVSDCLLFPGFVDAHTHFDLEVAGTVTADDFTSGSRAALRGGTTTIIDFACPRRGETMSLHRCLDRWRKKAAAKTFCDYGFHMTINNWDEAVRGELPDMFAQGVSSFKMYMTYPDQMLGDRDLYWALKELKRLGGLCGVHCENAGVIEGMAAEKKAAGELGPASHPQTRPAGLEAEAVARLLRIAQAAECPVLIVHLSSAEAMREVQKARKRGQTVYVETCPQYLILDESVYFAEEYSAAARYVCAPPLRTEEDQTVLWKALCRGEIQTVSTDHCAFTLEQKDLGREDFTRIPGGLPGVETRGELLWTCGVAKRRISAAQMCRALCEYPARLYGLFPRKGLLQPGSDADIVVYSLKENHTIRAEDCLSAAGYSPYEGMETSGRIQQVWLRGRLAVENGKLRMTSPLGEYLSRGKCGM